MTTSMSWELDREHEESDHCAGPIEWYLRGGCLSQTIMSQLLATPLQPLREQWYSAAQAELLRTARARHEISPVPTA